MALVENHLKGEVLMKSYCRLIQRFSRYVFCISEWNQVNKFMNNKPEEKYAH